MSTFANSRSQRVNVIFGVCTKTCDSGDKMFAHRGEKPCRRAPLIVRITSSTNRLYTAGTARLTNHDTRHALSNSRHIKEPSVKCHFQLLVRYVIPSVVSHSYSYAIAGEMSHNLSGNRSAETASMVV